MKRKSYRMIFKWLCGRKLNSTKTSIKLWSSSLHETLMNGNDSLIRARKVCERFLTSQTSRRRSQTFGADFPSCGWKSASSRALNGQFGECLQKWMWEGVDNVWHYLKLIALLCVAQEQRKSLSVSMLCKCNWFFMLSRGVLWTRRPFRLKCAIQSVTG